MKKNYVGVESLLRLLEKNEKKINLFSWKKEEIEKNITFFSSLEKSDKVDGVVKNSAYFKRLFLQDRLDFLNSQSDRYLLLNAFKETAFIKFAGGDISKPVFVDNETGALFLLNCTTVVTCDGWLSFKVVPVDKLTAFIQFSVDYEKMPNGLIYAYNEQFNLNVPQHKKEDYNGDFFDDEPPSLYDKRFIFHGANLRNM